MRSFDKANFAINVEEAIEIMKKGTPLLKYGRRGTPHFRLFRLSADLSRLEWFSPKKQEAMSAVELSSVSRIQVGQATKVFERHKRLEMVSLSFSLLYDDRSLDLVCKDKREFDIWFHGLRALLEGWRQRVPSFHVPSSASLGNGMMSVREKSGSRNGDITTIKEGRENADDDSISVLSSNDSASTFSDGASIMSSRSSKPLHVAVEKLREAFYTRYDVYTWGGGDRGQLGHGDSMTQRLPRLLEGMLEKDIRSLSCGSHHAAALTENGELYTWGESSGGRLGHGIERDSSIPNVVADFKGKVVRQVECGDYHTVCLLDNGEMYTFGSGEQGQLGHGSKNSQWFPHLVLAFFGQTVVHIAAGPWHTMAVLDNGEIYSWGEGCWGQLGHGDRGSRDSPCRIEGMAGKKVVKAVCGVWHSGALTDSGDLYVWGDNDHGQLGTGDKTNQYKPRRVDALVGKKLKEVGFGRVHSVALTESGHVYSWGSGNIGHGCTSRQLTPMLIKRLEGIRITQIATGPDHTAALTELGELYSWGDGSRYRLGHTEQRDEAAPKLVDALGGKRVRFVACGEMFCGAVCAHLWLPEELTGACMKCKLEFSFVRRKHHCRHCGGIFCHSCSTKRFPLLKFGYEEPVRVCDSCFSLLSASQDILILDEKDRKRRSSGQSDKSDASQDSQRKLSSLLRMGSLPSSNSSSEFAPKRSSASDCGPKRSSGSDSAKPSSASDGGPRRDDASEAAMKRSTSTPVVGDSMMSVETGSTASGDTVVSPGRSRDFLSFGRDKDRKKKAQLEQEIYSLRVSLQEARCQSQAKDDAFRRSDQELRELRRQCEIYRRQTAVAHAVLQRNNQSGGTPGGPLYNSSPTSPLFPSPSPKSSWEVPRTPTSIGSGPEPSSQGPPRRQGRPLPPLPLSSPDGAAAAAWARADSVSDCDLESPDEARWNDNPPNRARSLITEHEPAVQQVLEEFAPGVYMTLLKKVEVVSIHFNKEMFSEEEASKWWEEHEEQVFARYGPLKR